jgi:hypothetical protein
VNREEFYVYIHYRVDSLEPFYVGKGCGNCYKDAIKRNQYWHRIVSKCGFIPKILPLVSEKPRALARGRCQ